MSFGRRPSFSTLFCLLFQLGSGFVEFAWPAVLYSSIYLVRRHLESASYNWFLARNHSHLAFRAFRARSTAIKKTQEPP